MVLLFRSAKFGPPAALLAMLAACAPSYSPNTYSPNAVQQANKVEPGVVVGFREVQISANGTVGAVTGGAAGGILGSQVGSTSLQSALGGVTGTAVGALVGATIEHAAGDTTGWEYIVRKHNGDLLSLTQREPNPLPLGQKVLVITGAQARIIPDYSVDTGAPVKDAKAETRETPTPPPAPPPPTVVVVPVPAGALPAGLLPSALPAALQGLQAGTVTVQPLGTIPSAVQTPAPVEPPSPPAAQEVPAPTAAPPAAAAEPPPAPAPAETTATAKDPG